MHKKIKNDAMQSKQRDDRGTKRRLKLEMKQTTRSRERSYLFATSLFRGVRKKQTPKKTKFYSLILHQSLILLCNKPRKFIKFIKLTNTILNLFFVN